MMVFILNCVLYSWTRSLILFKVILEFLGLFMPIILSLFIFVYIKCKSNLCSMEGLRIMDLVLLFAIFAMTK